MNSAELKMQSLMIIAARSSIICVILVLITMIYSEMLSIICVNSFYSK